MKNEIRGLGVVTVFCVSVVCVTMFLSIIFSIYLSIVNHSFQGFDVIMFSFTVTLSIIMTTFSIFTFEIVKRNNTTINSLDPKNKEVISEKFNSEILIMQETSKLVKSKSRDDSSSFESNIHKDVLDEILSK